MQRGGEKREKGDGGGLQVLLSLANPLFSLSALSFPFLFSISSLLAFLSLPFTLSSLLPTTDNYLNTQVHASNDSFVAVLVNCKNGNGFSDISQKAQEALDTSVQYGCDAAYKLCNETNGEVQCPATCTENNLADFKLVVCERGRK